MIVSQHGRSQEDCGLLLCFGVKDYDSYDFLLLKENHVRLSEAMSAVKEAFDDVHQCEG